MSRATSRSRGLTARQVRGLLASGPAPDPEVSDLTITAAYRFADGRELLVLEDGKGRLHESRADLLAMLGEVAGRTPASPFGPLLPQGRDFPAKAPALAAELSVPVLTGLPRLDDVVRRAGPDACRTPPMFARLVAYVGETIIAVSGGGWQMRLAADGATWEPWVVDAGGGRHEPAGLVYKELAEWATESSLAGVVAGHLRILPNEYVFHPATNWSSPASTNLVATASIMRRCGKRGGKCPTSSTHCAGSTKATRKSRRRTTASIASKRAPKEKRMPWLERGLLKYP